MVKYPNKLNALDADQLLVPGSGERRRWQPPSAQRNRPSGKPSKTRSELTKKIKIELVKLN